MGRMVEGQETLKGILGLKKHEGIAAFVRNQKSIIWDFSSLAKLHSGIQVIPTSSVGSTSWNWVFLYGFQTLLISLFQPQ